MKKKLRYVGLDIYVESIAGALAEEADEPRSLGAIPNTSESVRKLIIRLGPCQQLRICNQAGLCGFVLCWQLQEMGVHFGGSAASVARRGQIASIVIG
jgi:transposase